MTADVLVAGGGPAGAAAALALARGGARVVLVDAGTAADAVGEGLPPAGVAEVEALGAAAALVGHLEAPGTLSAWGDDRPEHHDFLLSPWARGLHLDRPRFDAALRELAREAGAELVVGRLREARRDGGLWETPMGRAPWIVDATGRRAAVARALGSARVGFDRLVAVGGVCAAADEGPRTVIEAAPDGWWYQARLPGDRVQRLLFVDEAAPLRDPVAWAAALAATRLLGRGALAPRALPASTTLLDPPGGEGWLAVGDAASTVDPLSSAGVTRALRSGRSAAAAILGGDPASHLDRERRTFESLLAGRAAVYAREGRWPDRPFWARRRGAVWLDPAERLGPVRGRLPTLTAAEQAVVRATCPAPAEVVVAALTAGSPLSARRALLALQEARALGRL